MRRRALAAVAAALGGLGAGQAPAQDWAAVAAILQDRCVECHSGLFPPLGLGLETYTGLMLGSQNGPVVSVDQPSESRIIKRLTGAASPRMPLDGPPFLSDAGIAAILGWIEAGAPGPEDANAATATPKPPPNPYADGQITYDEVAAIFGRNCIACHSLNSRYEAPPEGLRLDSYEAILAGGERLVVLPGNPQASEIIRRIEGLASPRMPFDGPPWLGAEDIALLRDWIDGGARAEDGTPAPVPVGARVRLRGRLTGPAEIDGAAFAITDGTRIDDRPAIGDAAEVRGRIAADGTIIADRFRDR